MSNRRSIKLRLADAIETKLETDDSLSRADRWAWSNILRDIRALPPGRSLPLHLRELARSWEIEA